MLNVVIEVVLAPALVGAATLAARRWGERTGGLVSAFPAIVGPVLLVTALEHGAAFAARAASGTLLGLVALSAFTLAYARAARRLRWPASLAAGWAAAGAAGLAVSAVTAGPAVALAAAAASLALAHRLLGAAPHAANDAGSGAAARPLPPRRDIPLRMALTATLVVCLTWAAGRFGAVAGGILAALTHRRLGADAVCVLLRGMLAGLAGFVGFCLVVATVAERAGIAVAFAAATVIALAVQVAVARAGERSAERPGRVFPGAAYEQR
jgi:hypothetical protein